MFDPQKLYPQAEVAVITHRSVRSVRNWRERKLLPDPDVLLGGKDPAWWGSTLNSAPAFEKPAA